jgi:bifunctional enzyme CysN/CysC
MIYDNKLINESKSKVSSFIESQENLSLLRFITCGSVDDGKSTLIGRMLFEAQTLFEDQIQILKNDSKKHGTQGAEIDYALLLDGLSAEREQGITIDVAYRFFSTHKRKFIVADTPGHEQYTRNMITGASTADAAIILIDARKGLLEQTKRHSFLTSLVGIKNIIVAVNKMDLIDFNQETYNKIISDYKEFAENLNYSNIFDIPISALKGDNVIQSSKNLNWFKGPALLPLLETIKVDSTEESFILPIQNVIRPNLDYRAFCGKVSSGVINLGDKIKSLPSGESAKISSINIGKKNLKKALTDQSISITLDREIDISRGDVVCNDKLPVEISNIFDVNVCWLSDNKCYKGRNYFIKIGSQKVTCQIIDLKFKYDVNNLKKLPTKDLGLNDIANITISLNKDIPFTIFSENKSLGKLIIIDPLTNQTVGAAMINHSLRRAKNIHKHNLSITRELREKLNGNKAKLLWFTGLSGSGKSTIADLLEKKLYMRGIRTFILDGDNIRHGLNSDLGFSDADRVENIRRVAEVSKLMLDAGIFVLSSFISPFISDREMVRNMFSKGEFIEIYVNTPIEIAESRDPKGLYKKAREEKIPNFTGISSPYEEPVNPEIILSTQNKKVEENVLEIIKYIQI